jgi:hypothetical protein
MTRESQKQLLPLGGRKWTSHTFLLPVVQWESKKCRVETKGHLPYCERETFQALRKEYKIKAQKGVAMGWHRTSSPSSGLSSHLNSKFLFSFPISTGALLLFLAIQKITSQRAKQKWPHPTCKSVLSCFPLSMILILKDQISSRHLIHSFISIYWWDVLW